MGAAEVLALLVALTSGPRGPVGELGPWADAIASSGASRVEAAELGALADEESRFAPWVLDGSCNDDSWRRAHGMDRSCDGGRAVGPWQVHDARFLGAAPIFQAAEALAMLRAYPGRWSTWVRASERARTWLAGHP